MRTLWQSPTLSNNKYGVGAWWDRGAMKTHIAMTRRKLAHANIMAITNTKQQQIRCCCKVLLSCCRFPWQISREHNNPETLSAHVLLKESGIDSLI